ncbi:MAG: hypothetical protein GY751_09070, partial [Bacteroidetes bacterium]|nr:hypothetical protein [Bacteroidota bacterium]
MARSQFWPGYFQEVLHEHMHAYCDLYEIDTFEELSEAIGDHWLTCLNDMAFNDFLSRETEEEGNIVDAYLKRRGWSENSVSKAYLKGIRSSVVSLYEVSDIHPGISFLARDLIRGGDPVLVEERSATQTLAPWDHVAMLLVEVRGHTI